MPVFSGYITTSATSTAYSSPARIKAFSLVNKSGGAINVNVSILYGSTNIWITEFNKSLAANTAYRIDVADILIPTNHQIYVLVSGACDYYFSITGGEG